MKTFCLILGFLAVFYVFNYYTFLYKYPISELPFLRARMGTILSHSNTPFHDWEDSKSIYYNDPSQEFHTYCYYPSGNVQYPNKSGEYIIKRVKSFDECRDWFGAAIFKEGNWVTEYEKIWWKEDPKIRF